MTECKHGVCEAHQPVATPTVATCLTPIERQAAWDKWVSTNQPHELLSDARGGKIGALEALRQAFEAGRGDKDDDAWKRWLTDDRKAEVLAEFFDGWPMERIKEAFMAGLESAG